METVKNETEHKTFDRLQTVSETNDKCEVKVIVSHIISNMATTEEMKFVLFVGINVGLKFSNAKAMDALIKNVQDNSLWNCISVLQGAAMEKLTPGVYQRVRSHSNSKMEDLKYYEVIYSCKYDGRAFKSKRKNQARSTRYFVTLT